jgi:hypothetical protein
VANQRLAGSEPAVGERSSVRCGERGHENGV